MKITSLNIQILQKKKKERERERESILCISIQKQAWDAALRNLEC